MIRHTILSTLGAFALAVAPLAQHTSAQSGDTSAVRGNLPERFTAFAVSTGGPRSEAVATQIEMRVTRWSSRAEGQRLMQTLKDKGEEAMISALREMRPVGTISTPGELAYNLHYAAVEPGEDGGRHIVLATDRPISAWEAFEHPRVSQYPLTFVELRMNGEGEGEGRLAYAASVHPSYKGETLELLNYQTAPIQLKNVRRISD